MTVFAWSALLVFTVTTAALLALLGKALFHALDPVHPVQSVEQRLAEQRQQRRGRHREHQQGGPRKDGHPRHLLLTQAISSAGSLPGRQHGRACGRRARAGGAGCGYRFALWTAVRMPTSPLRTIRA